MAPTQQHAGENIGDTDTHMPENTSDHLRGMTVAVTGASGTLGTALLRRLTAPGSGVAEVRGLARRQPPDVAPYSGVRWHLADLGTDESEAALPGFLVGAASVVHLAWALQPGRHPEELRRVDVEGTRRVLHAAAGAGVGHVVRMSSIGAYAAGAVGQRVAEDWPTTGIPSAQYSRDKPEGERVASELAARHPDMTVSVVRPTLVLQPDARSEIGRYFLGPLVYGAARLLPGPIARLFPLPLPQLAVAFVHADDVADALVRILDPGGPGVQPRRRTADGRRRAGPHPRARAGPGHDTCAAAAGQGAGAPRGRGAARLRGRARPR